MTLIDSETSRAMIEKADAAIASSEIMLNEAHDLLLSDDIKVYSLQAGEVSAHSVTYRVGGDVSTLSNVTVIFDEDGVLSHYSEAIVEEGARKNFDVRSYVNGELVLDAQTDITYATDAEIRGDLAVPTAQVQTAAASTAQCIATALGISIIAAGVIAFLCSGSCSAPVTPPTATVCAACIVAAAAVGVGTGANAVNCFT